MKKFSRTSLNLGLCTLLSFFFILNLNTLATDQFLFSDRDIFTFPENVDLYFAYYPGSSQEVLLVPTSNTALIVLTRTPFEWVNTSMVDPSAWNAPDFAEIGLGDTVVLRSSTGNVYKLAFTLVATEEAVPQIQVMYALVTGPSAPPSPSSEATLQYYHGFDIDTGKIVVNVTVASVIPSNICGGGPIEPTQPPSAIPEPGSGLLFLLGLFGLFSTGLLVRRKNKQLKRTWWLLILVSVAAFILFGSPDLTMGEQTCLLTIEKSGSGTGRVLGRGIDCGTTCSVSYMKGEILNLKVIPDADSIFVGWLVNNEPYQEIIQMTSDTTLTARFDQLSEIERCMASITPRPDLEGKEREQAFQQEILQKCLDPSLPPCLGHLRGSANFDYSAAAARLVSGLFSPAQYLALSRDRSRKYRVAESDPQLAAKLCEMVDSDDDWVIDSEDRCPNTPELVATDDTGCPDTTVVLAPSAEAVKALTDRLGFVMNPRCSGAQVPGRVPTGGFYWPDYKERGSYIVVGRVDNQPPLCPVWYQFEIMEISGPTAGEIYSVAFMDREEETDLVALGRPVPKGFIQFNPKPTDPGTRGRLGNTGGVAKVKFRVRAMNGGGARGPWSDWKISTRQSCWALGFDCQEN